METFNIRLLLDLPIDKRFNCVKGNVYKNASYNYHTSSGRPHGVKFKSHCGANVVALKGEYEKVEFLKK